jgi:hypothetical protein
MTINRHEVRIMSRPVSALRVHHRQNLGQIEDVDLSKYLIILVNSKGKLVDLTNGESVGTDQ